MKACLLLLLCSPVLACHDGQGIVVRFVFPVERPKITIITESGQEAAAKEATRRQQVERQRQALIEQQLRIEEEQRQRALEGWRRAAEKQPKVDPEKDQFAQYKREQQWKEEAKDDPIKAEVRAKYRDDSDAFSRWKDRQPDKEEKPKPQKAEKVQPMDLREWMDRPSPPKAPKKKKEVVDE